MWDGVEEEDQNLQWLVDGLKSSSIIAVTDGSYDRQVAPNISGAGIVLCCTSVAGCSEQTSTNAQRVQAPIAANYWGWSPSTLYFLRSRGSMIWEPSGPRSAVTTSQLSASPAGGVDASRRAPPRRMYFGFSALSAWTNC